MSVWSRVRGEFYIRKDAHISLREMIKDHFDEVMVTVTKDEYYLDYFIWKYCVDFVYCSDGFGACRVFDKFLGELDSAGARYPARAICDVEMTIRWSE